MTHFWDSKVIECGKVVEARQTDLNISEAADLLTFFHTATSTVYREQSEKDKTPSE